MRVLLFVQTGDGRPKCVGAVGLLSASNDGPRSLKSFAGEYRMTWRQGEAYDRADRWWLVECENAEAGRRILAEDNQRGARLVSADFGNGIRGRILASGGKA